MITGKVKWFNDSKGYGFIIPDDTNNEEEIFVHFSSINMKGFKTLKAGQKVYYEILKTPKGTQASLVNIINKE